MTIEFDHDVQTSTFHNPLQNFEEVEVETKVRLDPLTKRQSRIVSESFIEPDDTFDIEQFVRDDDGCFFCPDAVEETTPEYPDWVDMDRGQSGEATSFPNLNPYGQYSNVVALTKAHYVPIDQFDPETFENGFAAGLEYVEAVFEHDDTATVGSVNMNFLRSAGASIVHPHLQTLVDDRGTNAQARRLENARDYQEANGTTYWKDLLAAERGGNRWIGSTGPVDWIAAYAPAHHRHVVGVFDGYNAVGPDDVDALSGLAEGITTVLEYYGEAGLNAFNLSLSLSHDETVPIVHVCNRSVFDEFYWSDASFFTTLHDEPIVDVAPETYAQELRDWF